MITSHPVHPECNRAIIRLGKYARLAYVHAIGEEEGDALVLISFINDDGLCAPPAWWLTRYVQRFVSVGTYVSTEKLAEYDQQPDEDDD